MDLNRVMLIFLAFASLYPVSGGHFCTIVDSAASCPSGSTELFTGSEYTNTHLNYTGVGSGAYKHCCSFFDQRQLIPATQSCASIGYEATILDFYQNDNSHLASPNGLTSADNYRLCVNNTQTKIECIYNLDDRSVSSPYIPVVYLFQQLNSHAELSNLTSIDQQSNPSYDDTVSCKMIPAPPTLINLFAVDKNTLLARVSDTSLSEVKFEFYGGLSSTPTTYIGETPSITQGQTGATYDFTWNGRVPNTTYYVRSRTVDEDGSYSDYSNELSRSTNASVPESVKVTTVDDSTINISWSHNGNPTNTVYTVYSGPRNNPNFITAQTCRAFARTWCLHQNARDDTQYCYHVSGMNSESVHSANSSSACSTTTFTSNADLTVRFDPLAMDLPKDGFVKTYLFVRNKGNVPDRFNINFAYDADEMEVVPDSAFLEMPADSWDRIELTVSAKNMGAQSDLIANIVSSTNSSKNGQATFSLRLVDIIGLPGIATWGLVMLALIGAAVLFI